MSNEMTHAEVRGQQQVWAERRKLWVRDLIHGDLRQGKQQLSLVVNPLNEEEHIPQKFCCLGVACKRYQEETGDGEWVDTYGDTAFHLTVDPDENNATNIMPEVVEEWYGLHNLELQFKDLALEEGFEIPHSLRDHTTNYIQNFLYICNDDLHMTLPEIGQVVNWINDMENHIHDLVSLGEAVVNKYPHA